MFMEMTWGNKAGLEGFGEITLHLVYNTRDPTIVSGGMEPRNVNLSEISERGVVKKLVYLLVSVSILLCINH